MPTIIERTLGWGRGQVARGRSLGAEGRYYCFLEYGILEPVWGLVSHPANRSFPAGGRALGTTYVDPRQLEGHKGRWGFC